MHAAPGRARLGEDRCQLQQPATAAMAALHAQTSAAVRLQRQPKVQSNCSHDDTSQINPTNPAPLTISLVLCK
jgi:hypothetical protein